MSDNLSRTTRPSKKIRPCEQKPDISQLPVNVLIEIINNITISQWSSLEQINNNFRFAVYVNWSRLRSISFVDDLVIREPIDENEKSFILKSILKKFLRRSPNIRSIGGFPKKFILGDIHFSLLSRFENLELISFNFADGNFDWHFRHFIENVDAKNLATFLRESKSRGRLKCLDLSRSGLCSTARELRILNGAFSQEIENLPPLKLQSIDFSFNMSIMGFTFDSIDASHLISLNLSHSPFNQWILIDLLPQCVRIQHLRFTFYYFTSNDLHTNLAEKRNLNRQVLKTIGEVENLISLEIGTDFSNMNLDDEDDDCLNPDDLVDTIATLGRHGILKEFGLMCEAVVSDETIKAIGEKLPNLTSLTLSAAHCLEWDSLPEMLSKMNSLEWLHLPADDPFQNSNAICNYAAQLIDDVPSLKYLYISFLCFNIALSDPTKSASLNWGEKIKDAVTPPDQFFSNNGMSMETWSREFCHRVESLEIPCCENVNDHELIEFIEKAPNLIRLNIRKADITDRSLIEIAHRCPRLRKLDISDCKRITSIGVQILIDKCTKLDRLIVEGHEDWFPSELKVEKYRKIWFK